MTLWTCEICGATIDSGCGNPAVENPVCPANCTDGSLNNVYKSTSVDNVPSFFNNIWRSITSFFK